jgi:hypothetical protein
MNIINRNIAIKKWLEYLPILLVTLFFSCSSNTKNNSNRIVDLPDSCFAYKNITSSLVELHLYYDITSGNLYKDSTKKLKLYVLDSIKKRRIIAPIICKDVTFRDSSYAAQYMSTYLVAKQDKLGDLTPIIFEVDGDDYDALIYTLLDKNDNLVSSFFLEGGLDGGPEIDTDTLILLSPQKVSFIKTNIISSYILHIYIRPKKDTTIYTVDSISYKTIINKDGQIKTSRIDSERYNRMPDKSWK